MTRSHGRQFYSVSLMVCALLIGLIVLAGCEREDASLLDKKAVKSILPETAIDFTLPDLAGKPHQLSEYLAKGPVVLVFFTTWCPYCKKAIPALKQLYRDYHSQGLQVIAVNAGLADSLEQAKRYALEHRLPYVVLYDADGVASGLYGVQLVPKIFYIRQNGSISRIARQVDRQAATGILSVKQ